MTFTTNDTIEFQLLGVCQTYWMVQAYTLEISFQGGREVRAYFDFTYTKEMLENTKEMRPYSIFNFDTLPCIQELF